MGKFVRENNDTGIGTGNAALRFRHWVSPKSSGVRQCRRVERRNDWIVGGLTQSAN